MKLRRRHLLVAPALLSAPAVLAQPKGQPKRVEIPLKWYRVQVEDNAFTVEMPGIPDHRIVNDRSPRGTVFTLHSYSLETGGYSYVVQTALYPEDVDVTQPRRILQAALDDRARQLAGRQWAKVEWRDAQGAAAVEASGPLAAGNALRQLVMLKQHRFVLLAFLGSIVSSVEAERFFRSVKLA